MKTILVLTRFIIAFLQPEPELKGAVIQAAGLTCAMCSNAIYKSLLTIPFIDQVEPDLSTSSFVISFKNEAPVNPDIIRHKIEDAGFSVASFTWNILFHQSDLKENTIFTVRDISFCLPESNHADGPKRLIMTDKNFTTARNLRLYDRKWKGKECEKSPDKKVYHVVMAE